MSIAETLLIFAGTPAAIVLLVFALVYGTSGRRTSKRYRPGRSFEFTPVWFVAARDQVTLPTEGTAVSAVTAGQPAPALVAAATGTPHDEPATAQYGDTGGASDSW